MPQSTHEASLQGASIGGSSVQCVVFQLQPFEDAKIMQSDCLKSEHDSFVALAAMTEDIKASIVAENFILLTVDGTRAF